MRARALREIMREGVVVRRQPRFAAIERGVEQIRQQPAGLGGGGAAQAV
jgi:hypothetical protein